MRLQPALRLGILLICALILSSSACFAKVVYVKWDSPGTGDPITYDGTSWTTAYHKIGDAIPKAVSGDELWVAAGTYTPYSPGISKAVSLYGGFAGGETAREQRNPRTNTTIIDGGNNYFCVVYSGDDVTPATIDGFTMQNASQGIAANSRGTINVSNNTFKLIFSSAVCMAYGGSHSIQNNLIYKCGYGVSMGSGGTTTITGNTIVGCITGIGGAPSNAIIANNIIAFGTCGISQRPGVATLQLSHNDVYCTVAILGLDPTNYLGCSAGPTDISVDPMLVSYATGDCHLRAESPCCNAGDNAAVGLSTIDIDGDVRILKGVVDIGADESVADQVATPRITPTGNGLSFPADISTTCATDGATIRYTTNGADPQLSDTVVSGPITLPGACTIKARAWKTGMIWSPVASANYVAAENLVRSIKAKALNQPVTTDRSVVTCVMNSNQFYIESDDRSSGIRVSKALHGMTAGMRAKITGTLSVSSSEKFISATSVVRNGSGVITPLVVSNRDLGGADWLYNSSSNAGQCGMKEYRMVRSGDTWVPTLMDAAGLNNIGLFITTTGRITHVESSFFYIDDGSNLRDSFNYNSGYCGVRVYGAIPVQAGVDPVGMYVKVTGASSCFKTGVNAFRTVGATQVVVLQSNQ